MTIRISTLRVSRLLLMVTVGWWALAAGTAEAQRLRLKDGRVLEGKFLDISSVIDTMVNASDPEQDTKATPILVVDDNLRRTFVPKQHLVEILDPMPEPQVRIKLWQNTAQSTSIVGVLGPSIRITPFDEYGRRIYEMQTSDGPLAVVQGITELTHRYAKVETLQGPQRKVVWDMRIATSSIPRDKLAEILDTAVSKDKPDDWLQVVRLYLQGERYQEARWELNKIIARFPGKRELQAEARQLQQLGARRIMREIELRQSAGQHELVSRLLANFPTEEVAGETLQEVREIGAKDEQIRVQIAQLAEQLKAAAAAVSDTDHRRLIDPIIAEIVAALSPNTIDRLVPFAQLYDDDELTAEGKVALAVTGWLLGGKNASQELPVAVSLVEVREAVLQYLREPMAHQRVPLLESVRSLEGASVTNVAALLANMRPPWEIHAEADQKFGAYELSAPGHTEHGDFRYLVQLPPEYDPYRHYPTILALNGAYNSPLEELDFWAGAPRMDDPGKVVGTRNGQAMRYGYITIAVDWQKPQQYDYEYSLREHEAVLTCLRDACRRFGVDTDRVFLTGHGIGGDAAWDFAQAHPDLWAGAIPFVARSQKYVPHYWDNATYVPLYFVAGQLDGKKMSDNADVLNKYFRSRFDTTVVEYLGRGQEPFHDEILALFDWMGRRSRGPAPQDFVCKTMRPWDNFFWWIEGQKFPRPVYPQNWPKSGARPTEVEGKLLNNNILSARSASETTTIWLSPDVVDFNEPIRVTLNGRKITDGRGKVEPSLEVLLEDVRTRADRLRPFWAKLEVP